MFWRQNQIGRWFACIFWIAGLVSHAPPLKAQGTCEEPTDEVYLEQAERIRMAIENEEYPTAIEYLEWTRERYGYALVHYTLARAYHRVGRLEQAQESYIRFLDGWQDCPDPANLRERANGYLQMAVTEQNRPTGVEPDQTAEYIPEPLVITAPPQVAPVPSEGGPGVGWWLVGGGGALILAGVVFDLANAGLLEDRSNAVDDFEEYSTLNEEVQRNKIIDAALYGSGLVLVAVGMVLNLIDSEPVPEVDELSLIPQPGGWIVRYGSRY